MSELEIGQLAPDFELPTDSGTKVTLSGLKGKWVVVYFYPKADTSGCTNQAIAFTQHLEKFAQSGCEVIGISKDTIESHKKFKAKYDLGVTLASDFGTTISETYGVWVEKSMYGRNYLGLERTSFLIDPNQYIAHIWRKVKVQGHVEAVLTAVKALKS
ncbi:thioredoxin-dependent thiol peroxidase [Candidatus Phycosocius spiralis]|uniref:thioredoxin-dependent peroxiredoxin n=1 Tax=Candidatus Phycosocius spiralis TaxID=2815099 RepID=A0ABQ4PWV8_9PROT|nr:thioredoxin-dependent thiol peroxidase [Candidatus Phycosocius spiralis]GIU67415.1 peroxiredoxin [Candidatus Phycosocius spiralis]